jgi:hypothetical protein
VSPWNRVHGALELGAELRHGRHGCLVRCARIVRSHEHGDVLDLLGVHDLHLAVELGHLGPAARVVEVGPEDEWVDRQCVSVVAAIESGYWVAWAPAATGHVSAAATANATRSRLTGPPFTHFIRS